MSAHRIEPRGLKPEEAAAYTGLSTTTLWRLAQAKRIRRIEDIGAVVYDRVSLDALFEAEPNTDEPLDPIAAKIAAL